VHCSDRLPHNGIVVVSSNRLLFDRPRRNLVEHAIRLSHEKYCSASIMLGKTAEITKDFAIIEA